MGATRLAISETKRREYQNDIFYAALSLPLRRSCERLVGSRHVLDSSVKAESQGRSSGASPSSRFFHDHGTDVCYSFIELKVHKERFLLCSAP